MGTGKYANLVLQELNNSGYKDFTYIDPNRDCGYALCFIDPQGERTFISVPRCELYYQKNCLINSILMIMILSISQDMTFLELMEM